MKTLVYMSCFGAALLFSCENKNSGTTGSSQSEKAPAAQTAGVDLPAPYATPSPKNFSKVIGWPANKQPVAPAGFVVSKFADNLKNPRWIYVTPNGDILVAEANAKSEPQDKLVGGNTWVSNAEKNGPSANRITLFRDTDGDGTPDLRKVFLMNLNQPVGMLVLGNRFYVANTDGVYQYPYQAGQTSLTGPGEKIVNLPAGGHNGHWTRNIIANADQSKIFLSIGSASDHGEGGMGQELNRACILEFNPDGSALRIYASGLRNPLGIDLNPVTKQLWTSVNERDGLGDDLVPDFLTSVREGGFYGWPYSYFGQNPDPRLHGDRPDLVKVAIVPEVALGAHTASLGLAFYNQQQFPQKYHNGAFIGQHGSWNRSSFAGYRVAFVPFRNGKPAGKPEDFLTGFIADEKAKTVYGRPTGTTVLPDGALLVADDAGNTIWRVSVAK